jgi:hypothetical protein
MVFGITPNNAPPSTIIFPQSIACNSIIQKLYYFEYKNSIFGKANSKEKYKWQHN